MEFLQQVIDILLNLPQHLNDWAQVLGPWLYVVLFLIIFCETGLVVTPFLPGDSLLFALGALSGGEGFPLPLPWLVVLLWAAAVLGDAVNYSIGLRIGPKVFTREDSRLFNKKHLLRTQAFYEKHGGKTIVLARFIPIIRTFAPFVAGIGKMSYFRFAVYNVTGGLAWVALLVVGGHVFRSHPWVKDRFHVVIAAIIIISVLPVVVEFLRARREARRAASKAVVAIPAEGVGDPPGDSAS
jgi:membrane-associated protein